MDVSTVRWEKLGWWKRVEKEPRGRVSKEARKERICSCIDVSISRGSRGWWKRMESEREREPSGGERRVLSSQVFSSNSRSLSLSLSQVSCFALLCHHVPPIPKPLCTENPVWGKDQSFDLATGKLSGGLCPFPVKLQKDRPPHSPRSSRARGSELIHLLSIIIFVRILLFIGLSSAQLKRRLGNSPQRQWDGDEALKQWVMRAPRGERYLLIIEYTRVCSFWDLYTDTDSFYVFSLWERRFLLVVSFVNLIPFGVVFPQDCW